MRGIQLLALQLFYKSKIITKLKVDLKIYEHTVPKTKPPQNPKVRPPGLKHREQKWELMEKAAEASSPRWEDCGLYPEADGKPLST